MALKSDSNFDSRSFKPTATGRRVGRLLTGLVFMLMGSLHFVSPASFTKIVPNYLPWPDGLVYISGVFEILGGLGLLVPKYSKAASYGLIALLVAVFPANLHHALNNIQLGGLLNSPLYQWLRLPLQPVFIWWVWWCGKDRDK